MYIFDNNFIIDTLANRGGFRDKYLDILLYCLDEDIACISVNQIDTLRYIIKKEYKEIYDEYIRVEKNLKLIKTPSYVDFDNPLAKIDIEDYMIELSATSIGAKIITSDKKFLIVSKVAIRPDEFYLLEESRPKNIEFANLKKQYLLYQSEIEKEMDIVLNSTSYIMGSAVEKLESNLKRFTKAEYAITCSSGTDALLLAMMALDIGYGDEVITTPFTFIATAETIALLGAKPIFVDIDEKSYNIDPNKIEAEITPKTRAIISVSLYGQPSDIDKIQSIATKHNLKHIIDGAQSFGSTFGGLSDSNLGDISTTSFFPAKPLGCFGDGGALFTNDKALATKIKSLRVHGQSKRYHHKYIGLGGRMDALQCAIVDVKLRYYPKDLALRQEVAFRYSRALDGRDVLLPHIDDRATSAFAQYSIRVRDRDALQARLKEYGIPTAVHYPMPLHLQECFGYLGYKEGDFPISELISREIMSLPMNPYISDEEIGYIANLI
jgi:UDP-2-acetamido-2-deoxy-ribo-hexuluronate aminotransferase